MKLNFDKDVFSNGQVDSKLWLCRELENLNLTTNQTVYIYGGWHGLLGFLLLSRERMPINHIRSIDIDSNACEMADLINENYVFKGWKFKSIHANANSVEPLDASIVINTSCEHFDKMDWFNKIPNGTLVALQSNNLKHDHEITAGVNSIEEMLYKYPLDTLLYSGSLDFKYPDKSFTRFMLIGIKNEFNRF